MMTRALALRVTALIAAGLTATACAERTDESATTSEAVDTTAATTTQTPEQPSDSLLDPETATREQLSQVPNLNAQLADAIIAGRPYADMLAVDRLLAAELDEEQRKDVYRALFKPMDLNTATREEILLIPDVDPRMPHEFDEYRPYTDIEQFRREIGKYVSAEEVARYEKYVRIP